MECFSIERCQEGGGDKGGPLTNVCLHLRHQCPLKGFVQLHTMLKYFWSLGVAVVLFYIYLNFVE